MASLVDQPRWTRSPRVVLSLFAVLNVILLLAAFAVRQPWADGAKQVAVPALPPEIQDLQVRLASGHHDEPYAVSLTDAELTAALAHYAATVPDVPFTGIQATILGDQVAVDAVTRGLAIPIPVHATVSLSASNGVPAARVNDVRIAGAALPASVHDQLRRQANSSLDLSQYDLPLTVDTLQLSPGNLAFAGQLK
jgi:hypothetical protein